MQSILAKYGHELNAEIVSNIYAMALKDLNNNTPQLLSVDNPQTVKESGINPLNKIMLPAKNNYEFIDIHNIIRIQALGNYVQVYSNNNKRYTIYQKLSYYEDRLKDFNFMRVHRSHLINLSLVNTFQKIGRGGFIIMIDESKVQISPNCKQMFLSKF